MVRSCGGPSGVPEADSAILVNVRARDRTYELRRYGSHGYWTTWEDNTSAESQWPRQEYRPSLMLFFKSTMQTVSDSYNAYMKESDE